DGFAVWIDRASIDAGSTWSHEIEQAIQTCDVALALLSHGSYHSEMCRAEQIRCLDLNKPVFPLLIKADAPRPIHLYARQFLDFSQPARYRQQMDTLKQALRSPKRDQTDFQVQPTQRTSVNTAPQLPPNFVPRDAMLERL